jgi:hypothetical protein
MILNTLFPFTPTFDEPRRYTGRSKKKLRPVVTYEVEFTLPDGVAGPIASLVPHLRKL